jgi:hypothetical protein
MPSQLRDLFCQICVWGNAVDTIQLFEKYKNHFIEDYIKQYPYEFALTSDLLILKNIFACMEKPILLTN